MCDIFKCKICRNIVGFVLLFALIIGGAVYFNHIRVEKLKENKEINIVFTSDLNYKEYTKVAIKSAIMNKNRNSIYHINILCVDLTPEQADEFKVFAKNNVTIRTVPLKLESIADVGKYETTNYVSRADLFKFFMADLFPELDKILYIDSDTIIRKDLTDLYNTDILFYPIGAVKRTDPNIIETKNIFGKPQIKAVYTYNCGVLLYNLKYWRKANLKEKLIKAKNADTIRDLQTQRSFNDVIPIGRIKLLSPVYNTTSILMPDAFKKKYLKTVYAPFCDDINDTEDFMRRAVIVHYKGPLKPWSYDKTPWAEQWWYYAKLVNPNWQVEPDRTIVETVEAAREYRKALKTRTDAVQQAIQKDIEKENNANVTEDN